MSRYETKKNFACLLAFIILLSPCIEGRTEEDRRDLTIDFAMIGGLACGLSMTAQEAQGTYEYSDTEFFLGALGCFVIGGLIGYYITNYFQTDSSSSKDGLQTPSVMFSMRKEEGTNKEYPIGMVTVLHYRY